MSAIHNLNDFQESVEIALLEWEKQVIKGDLIKINLLLLGDIFIDYFGAKTAIKYLVSIKKDPKGKVYLSPFDAKSINDIHDAILNFKVNWQVTTQGEVICLSLPMITTEKKEMIIKNWKTKTEQSRINIRNLRHALLNYLKNEQKLGKEELISEQKKIQKIIDTSNQKIDEILKAKINELLKV